MDKGFRLTLNGLSATGIPWRLLGEKLLGLICEFTQGVLSKKKNCKTIPILIPEQNEFG